MCGGFNFIVSIYFCVSECSGCWFFRTKWEKRKWEIKTKNHKHSTLPARPHVMEKGKVCRWVSVCGFAMLNIKTCSARTLSKDVLSGHSFFGRGENCSNRIVSETFRKRGTVKLPIFGWLEAFRFGHYIVVGVHRGMTSKKVPNPFSPAFASLWKTGHLRANNQFSIFSIEQHMHTKSWNRWTSASWMFMVIYGSTPTSTCARLPALGEKLFFPVHTHTEVLTQDTRRTSNKISVQLGWDMTISDDNSRCPSFSLFLSLPLTPSVIRTARLVSWTGKNGAAWFE